MTIFNLKAMLAGGFGLAAITACDPVHLMEDTEMTETSTVSVADIAGKEWVVEDLNDAGIPDMANATLNFTAEGGVSGHTGCNRYSGSWTEADGEITLSPLATTRMACAPALMDMERKFLNALTSPLSMTLDETGLLTVTGSGGIIEAR